MWARGLSHRACFCDLRFDLPWARISKKSILSNKRKWTGLANTCRVRGRLSNWVWLNLAQINSIDFATVGVNRLREIEIHHIIPAGRHHIPWINVLRCCMFAHTLGWTNDGCHVWLFLEHQQLGSWNSLWPGWRVRVCYVRMQLYLGAGSSLTFHRFRRVVMAFKCMQWLLWFSIEITLVSWLKNR